MSKTKEKINSPEEFLKLDQEERFNDCDLTWDSVVDYIQAYHDQQLELFKEKLKKSLKNISGTVEAPTQAESYVEDEMRKRFIKFIDSIKL